MIQHVKDVRLFEFCSIRQELVPFDKRKSERNNEGVPIELKLLPGYKAWTRISGQWGHHAELEKLRTS